MKKRNYERPLKKRKLSPKNYCETIREYHIHPSEIPFFQQIEDPNTLDNSNLQIRHLRIKIEFLNRLKKLTKITNKLNKGYKRELVVEDILKNHIFDNSARIRAGYVFTSLKDMINFIFSPEYKDLFEILISGMYNERNKKELYDILKCKKKEFHTTRHLRNKLLAKLLSLKTDVEKRKMEKKLLLTNKRLFFEIRNILIPEDIMKKIFSYIPRTLKWLNMVGTVCETFYLLFLKNWSFIKITSKNLYKIPILVLRNVESVRIYPKSILKKEYKYLLKELNPKKITMLGLWNMSTNINTFLNSLKEPFIKCKKLYINNLYGIDIKQKYFPKVRRLMIGGCFNSSKSKKIIILKDCTKSFIQNIKEVKLMRGKHEKYNLIEWNYEFINFVRNLKLDNLIINYRYWVNKKQSKNVGLGNLEGIKKLSLYETYEQRFSLLDDLKTIAVKEIKMRIRNDFRDNIDIYKNRINEVLQTALLANKSRKVAFQKIEFDCYNTYKDLDLLSFFLSKKEVEGYIITIKKNCVKFVLK